MSHSHRDFENLGVSRQIGLNLMQSGRPVIWMHQLFPGFERRSKVFVTITELGFPSRRVEHDVGFEIPIPKAIVLSGKLQAFLIRA